MGQYLSTTIGEQQSDGSEKSDASAAKTQLVNVRKFVMDNINDAFTHLHNNAYMGSNCYALLHTLTQGSITSDRLNATGLSVLSVAFEGTTEMSDVFPDIYYRMFQVILNQTAPYDDGLVDKTIYLFEKKQKWIRNPSEVVNHIVDVTGGVRYIIAQSTETQNNALNKACKKIDPSAKSAGGADVKCSMSKIFTGATLEQANRCCICGVGEPPELTDIEHVVSSQLLILLGICPATKSWSMFWQVFNDFNSNEAGRVNWVEQVINFFPSEQREDARMVFRSMMLPAHSHCNRTIKSEYSPLGINLETGTITGYIDQPFVNMDNKTYIEKVIEPSITYANESQIKSKKMTGEKLTKYKNYWIENQRGVFSDIASFLNSIDQRNNDASLGLIQFLYNRASKSNQLDKNAFVELVSDLLGFEKGRIEWNPQLYDIIYEDPKSKLILIIVTKLTLVVEAVLVLFQSDVQDPEQEITGATSQGDSSYAPTGSSQEEYMTTDTSFGSEVNVSLLSPGFSPEVKNEKSLFSYVLGNNTYTDNGGNDAYIDNGGFDAYIDNGGIDADIDASHASSQESAGSTFSNELGDNRGQQKIDTKNTTRDERIDAFNETRAKQENDALNARIQEIADRALAKYEETPDKDGITHALSNIDRTRLTRVAKTAARDVLSNKHGKRDTDDAAFNNAFDALNNNNNDSDDNEYENELAGGSLNRTTRKYTTRRRRSTRKRRPSKKPRRTIRRQQRRNNKRTQKRRK